LLAAQAADAIDDFRQENRRLVQSLRAIGPDVAEMLALQTEGGSRGTGEAAFLQTLEKSVAEVGKVTTRLRDADSRSHALGAETATTVKGLGHRLQIIHQVTNEVHNMAWNTDLRCYHMGREGNGLARVAAEIRSFVSTLETISKLVASAVGRLNEAAQSIAAQSENQQATGETLGQSLETIREGARRISENLSNLDGDAGLVAKILSEAADAVDCEATFADSLDAIAQEFSRIARPATDLDAETSALAQGLLVPIAKLYTMAKERAIHQRFAPTDAGAGVTENASPPLEDDDDDGLF
jgi:methyl-accepting chemotaxis protein